MRLPSPLALGLLALTALGACEEAVPEAVPVEVAMPAPAPAPTPAPDPAPPVAAAPSAESEALALYYRRLQADLLAQGLLRGDGGGADAPVTDTMLARNFVAIALFDEYAPDGGDLGAGTGESRLRRWDGPIRMEVVAGASVPVAQAARDRASVAAYAGRLSRLTGVPIAQVEGGANFHVAVLSEDDREAFGPRLRELVPGISEASARTFLNLPRSTLCLVIAFSDGAGDGYGRAVALIRAEHPDLLRTACIHEELAQGMGLANDSPQARPSIFNDDEEFGLLTGHDEMLLRMLYDARLRTGMTRAEAEPVARALAREMLEGGPS